jgi:WD40 repeat protein
VWDAITGEFVLQARLPIVNGISPEGMDVAFSPDGSSLYVLPLMGDLVRVTVADGAVETVVVTAANPLDSRTALTLSPDGAQAAIVTTNQLLVVNLADGAVVQSLGSPARAADVTFSPDSAQVTGAFSGGLTQVWATVTGERIGSTQVEGAPIVRLASLPSGALAALDQTNTLSLDGLPVVQVMDGFSNYSLLEASASGVFVTQGAEGRGLRIFDGSGAQTREWVNDASANVTAAAVSPDGSLVAYGLESTGFGVFSAADGVVIKGGSLGRGLASALAIAPDNQRLMLASGANVLAYPIDPNSEGGLRPDQTPFVTTATFGAVYDLAISPDGALMAAVGSDGTLWVWDMASGAEVYRSPVLTAPLRSVTFSPDGAWIATAGEDGTVRVWGVR